LQRLHLLYSAGSDGSCRPQPAHAQNLGVAVNEASEFAVAAAAAAAAARSSLELAGTSTPRGAVAGGGEALGSALLPADRLAPVATPDTPSAADCAGASTPAPASLPVTCTAASAGVAAHAEHFRVPAGFLFWLLVNDAGGLSVLHAAHRILAGGRGGGWRVGSRAGPKPGSEGVYLQIRAGYLD